LSSRACHLMVAYTDAVRREFLQSIDTRPQRV